MRQRGIHTVHYPSPLQLIRLEAFQSISIET